MARWTTPHCYFSSRQTRRRRVLVLLGLFAFACSMVATSVGATDEEVIQQEAGMVAPESGTPPVLRQLRSQPINEEVADKDTGVVAPRKASPNGTAANLSAVLINAARLRSSQASPHQLEAYGEKLSQAAATVAEREALVEEQVTQQSYQKGLQVRLQPLHFRGLCLDYGEKATAEIRWCDRRRASQGVLVEDVGGLQGTNGTLLRHAVHTSICLNVESIRIDEKAALNPGGGFNGAPVLWAPCDGGSPSQLWRWQGRITPVVANLKACLDVTQGALDKTPLQLWACHPGQVQNWKILIRDGDDGEEEAATTCRALTKLHEPYKRAYLPSYEDASAMYTYPFVNCADQDPKANMFTIMTQLDLDLQELYNLTQRQAYLPPGRSSPRGFAALSVTQLHNLLPQRLSRLLAMAIAFDGTVSVAVKLRTMLKDADVTRMSVEAGTPTPAQLRQCWQVLAGSIGLWLPPQLAKRIDLHVVHYSGIYNTNVGRNVAMEHARSPYIITTDVDFVPSGGMAKLLEPYKQQLCGQFRVILLPDFQVHSFEYLRKIREKGQMQLPNAVPGGDINVIRMQELTAACASKDVVTAALNSGVARRYHEERAKNSSAGYSFASWTYWDTSQQIPERDMQQNCETFYAFHRDDNFPRFEERLAGRGWNRISQTDELRAAGYQFVVHPTAFLCHPAEHFIYNSDAWKQQNDNGRIYYNEFLPGMFNRLADSEVAFMRQRERQRTLETCFDRRIS